MNFLLISTGMRILRASDGVNTMVCDDQSIVLGLLNKTIEVYDRHSLKKVNDQMIANLL